MKFKKIFIKFLAIILILNLNLIGFISIGLAQEATSSSNEAAAQNVQTGQSSDNTAADSTQQTVENTTVNESTVVNETQATSDSGDNSSSANTGDASINTAQAQVTTNTETNTNEIIYDPMPWTTWTGDGDWQTRSAENSQTGQDSTNSAQTSTDQTSSTTNNNDAQVRNDIATTATTGSNTASDNTGNASIITQNALISTTVKNTANTTAWTGEGDWTNLWQGEAINAMTGANSTNESRAEFNALLEVLNENNIDVENLINSYAATGDNTASQNTGKAHIITGDSSVLSSIFNLANTNIFGTDTIDILYEDIYGSFSGDIDLSSAVPISLSQLQNSPLLVTSENQTTGSNSTNTANTAGSLLIDVTNNNTGDLLNDLDLSSITGGNIASDNTGSASILTGDASIIANLINFLNTNVFASDFLLGSINVYGDWSGNLILPEYSSPSSSAHAPVILATNDQTGANSTNNSTNSANNSLAMNNTNDGTVVNDYHLTLETGANSTSDNTLSGSSLTGEVEAVVNEANYINNNIETEQPWWLILVNNLGNWTPVLVSPTQTQIVDVSSLTNPGTQNPILGASNNLTGSLSDNNATNELSAEVNVTNNNTGQIVNQVNAQAITGGNQADRNTGESRIETGDASILVNSLNFLNTNVKTPHFLVTVVNVFGSWMGDILNFGAKPNVPTDTLSNTNTNQTPITTSSPTPNTNDHQEEVNNNSHDNSNSISTNTEFDSNTSTKQEPSQINQIASKLTPSGGTVTTSQNEPDFSAISSDEAQVLSFYAENTQVPNSSQQNSSALVKGNLNQGWLWGLAFIPFLISGIMYLKFKLVHHPLSFRSKREIS